MKAGKILTLFFAFGIGFAIASSNVPTIAFAAGGGDGGGGSGSGGGGSGGGGSGGGGSGGGGGNGGSEDDGVSASAGASGGPRSTSGTASRIRVSPIYAAAVKAVEAADYTSAIQLLQKVVAQRPRHAGAYNYLGFAHRKLNQFDAAFAFYTKALELQPDHRGAHEYLGELFLDIGQVGRAEKQLAALQKVCPAACEEHRELKEEIEKYWNSRTLAAVHLVIGNSLRLDKSPPSRNQDQGIVKGYVEKMGGALRFQMESVDWPGDATQFYRGSKAIVRYDLGRATYIHTKFSSDSLEKVIEFFTECYGPPTGIREREIAPLAATRQSNPIFVWQSSFPSEGLLATLEISKYDDSQRSFPDTRNGAILLYHLNTGPEFPELSAIDRMTLGR